MIPKSIYQTFYTKNLPRNISNLISRMKEVNPDYDVHLFDDGEIEQFIKTEMSEDVYKAFSMLKVGAAKADLWRYCVLYKRGGVYLDLDSEIYKNLDALTSTESSAIVSRETHKGLFLQWCLMFDKEHPILKICIDKCVRNILSRKTENILFLTGPRVFSESVVEYCVTTEMDVWSTSDEEINKIIKSKGLDLKIYSTDFKYFCRFKNDFSYEIENFNLINQRSRHWTEEKQIFNNENNFS